MQFRGKSAARMLGKAMPSTSAAFMTTQRRHFETPAEYSSVMIRQGNKGEENLASMLKPFPVVEECEDSMFECGNMTIPTFTTEMIGDIDLELNSQKNVYGIYSNVSREHVIYKISEADAHTCNRILARLVNDGDISLWWSKVFKYWPAWKHVNCLGNETIQNEFRDFMLEATTLSHSPQLFEKQAEDFTKKLWHTHKISPDLIIRITEKLMEAMEEQPLTTPNERRILRSSIQIVTKVMHNSSNNFAFMVGSDNDCISNQGSVLFRPGHEGTLKEKLWGSMCGDGMVPNAVTPAGPGDCVPSDATQDIPEDADMGSDIPKDNLTPATPSS